MDCEEAGLETEWAISRRLSCTVQGRAISSDKGGGGDGWKWIDIEYVLEEQIGLVEAEEKKELKVPARMIISATSYIIVLLTEMQMLGRESRVLFWP